MIDNWFFFARFIISLLCFFTYFFYLIPRQANEVIQPVDGLTRLRWQILGLLLLIAITLIPAIVYQYVVATGHEYRVLRNIVSICGGVNLVGLTIGWLLIFTYRKK